MTYTVLSRSEAAALDGHSAGPADGRGRKKVETDIANRYQATASMSGHS